MQLRQFMRKTFLWVALLPLAVTYLGTLSNQAVLWANHDAFPVMINPVKLQQFTGGQPVADTTDPTGGRQIAQGGHVFVLPDGRVMVDPVHCVMTKSTHLNWLADIFDFHDSIQSIGDLLIGVGEWLSGFAYYVWAILVIGALAKKQD